MRLRTLGKAGFEVSEVGFGAWGIGGDWWKGSSDDEALAALSQAVDLGITFVDTAMGYGAGHSERLIGQALRGRPDRVRVGTKVRPMNYNFSPKPGDSFSEAFSAQWIIDSTEQSLQNLGQDTLDLQMMHVWLDQWASFDGWKEAVVKLKEQGKIRAFGLSLVFPFTEAHIPQQAIATGLIDACEVVYNIYQQEPQKKLFPLAQQSNVGIIARCPFDEGSLTGMIGPETTFPEGDWRNDYFRGDRKQQVYDHAQALQWLLQEDVESLPEAALRFCLSHPAVSTVIAGVRRARHVQFNVRAAEKGPLPAAAVERLKSHAWPHDFWA